MKNRTCSATGCSNVYYSTGYCMPHYRKWRRYGDPFGKRVYPKTFCKVEGCGRRAAGWEMCDAHYRRWKRTGDVRPADPLTVQYADAEEAFAARTSRDPETGCLIWEGVLVKGYGQIIVDGDPMGAHRYAWERQHGPIPSGVLIDHRCWNTACVEVGHLRIATHGENSRYLSGATARSRTGVRNVYPYRGGYRVRVVKDGIGHDGGHYAAIPDAAEAAKELRAELFGEFAGRG